MAAQTFGAAIEKIENSLLAPDQLYERRREQVAELTAQLGQTIDPAQIAAIVGKIDTISGAAWGQLDADQRASMGQEFVTFLRNAQALAEQQIAAGETALGSREAAVQSGVDLDLMRTAAETQNAAAQTFAGAAQLIADAIAKGGFGFAGFNLAALEVNR